MPILDCLECRNLHKGVFGQELWVVVTEIAFSGRQNTIVWVVTNKKCQYLYSGTNFCNQKCRFHFSALLPTYLVELLTFLVELPTRIADFLVRKPAILPSKTIWIDGPAGRQADRQTNLALSGPL